MKSTTNTPVAFEDGSGNVYIADSHREIILQMKTIEWGDTPSPLEWKERVAMRAAFCGMEIEFYDAISFLTALERHGLGRMRPDLLPTSGLDDTKSFDFSTEGI